MAVNVGDDYFVKLALAEARKALHEDEIPIGAVVVCENQIVGKGYNMVEKMNDATAHAEMLALTAAMEYFHSKYLQECTLYVTIEPCLMCASAAAWAQIKKLVFGAYDEKKGYSSYHPSVFHSKTKVIGGIMEAECAELLQDFFRNKR